MKKLNRYFFHGICHSLSSIFSSSFLVSFNESFILPFYFLTNFSVTDSINHLCRKLFSIWFVFQTQDENLFRPLAVEETTFDGGPDDYGDSGGFQAGHGENYGGQNGYPGHLDDGYTRQNFAGDNTLTNGGNTQQYNAQAEQTGRYSKTVQFPDQLNKSDTEKVRERSCGEKLGEETDLFVLYTARGRYTFHFICSDHCNSLVLFYFKMLP